MSILIEFLIELKDAEINLILAARKIDSDRAKAAKEIVDKKFGKDSSVDNAQKKYNKDVAYDAANRHIRRYSKNEAAIELAKSLLESYQPNCVFC